MRLEEIYTICVESQKIMEEVNEIQAQWYFTDEFQDQDKMKNLLTEFLGELKKIEVFRDEAELCERDIEKDIQDIIRANELYNKVKLVANVCKSVGCEAYKKDEVMFCVKIPQNSELVDFSKTISELNIILHQCPTLQDDEAKIKLKKVDVGSVWMDFIVIGVGATVILNNFAAFVDKTIAIWSHIKTCKQQEQQLKKMKLDNELMADMINTHKKITSNLEKKAIEELSADACSPEDETRMKMCIEKLVDLFDKGLEIHAAIEQKDVKPIFPVAEKWKELQEKSIGLLEDMSDGDEE